MQSQAKDVSQYLKEISPGRLEALTQLRQLCLTTLEGYEESMVYGMPSYTKDGTVEVAFASQKNYISFYILKEEVLNQHRPALQGVSMGKGCIRYSNPGKINYEVVKQLLADTVISEADVC